MGAVTAVMYAKHNSMFISSLILDSPFSDIGVMVNDIAKSKINIYGVTNMIVNLALRYMKEKIKSLLGFNILKIKPIEYAKNCTVPCVFIVGEKEQLVLPKRIKEFFKAYKG